MQKLALIPLFMTLAWACGPANSDTPERTADAPESRADPAPPSPADAPAPHEVQALGTQRQQLLRASKVAEAEMLCRAWTARKNAAARAEGHKCLANVFVHQGEDKGGGLMISDGAQRLAVGGTAQPPRFSGAKILEAIDELDKAAELSPTDVSIHQGRLFLCLASGNFERSVASLKLSIAQHKSASPETWLEYMGNFPRSAATHAAAFAEVVAKANPTSARALAELGAWQAVAGNAVHAKSNLARAIELAPDDAMAHWRMGELLEQAGDRAGAAAAYSKSLAVDGPLKEERESAYERFKSAK